MVLHITPRVLDSTPSQYEMLLKGLFDWLDVSRTR